MDRSNPVQYVLHGEYECDRLELQATIAGIDGHLRYMHLPERAKILDAGCGSGSMSRLLASRYTDATVIGLDLNPDYVAYARDLAHKAGLENVSFHVGDVQALPFAAPTFDLIWSKHVLCFIPNPEAALAEFRRVTKPGGAVLVALEYWPGIVFDAEDEGLRRSLLTVLAGVGGNDLPARLPTMLMRAGLVEVSVQIEASIVYTVIGAIDSQRKTNHEIEMRAARPYVAKILGSEAACDDFYATWFGYLNRPDTCTILPIWFVQGNVPLSAPA